MMKIITAMVMTVVVNLVMSRMKRKMTMVTKRMRRRTVIS